MKFLIFDFRFLICFFIDCFVFNQKSKIKNLKLSTLALLIIISTSALAEPNSASFQVDVPKGWVMDGKVGVGQGANTVFYPKNGSWRNSPAVMYIRTTDKLFNSLQRTIDDDLRNYKDASPQIVLSDEPNLFTKDGEIARVKKLKDNESGNLEISAYVAEEQIVAIITLNARNEKEAAKAMPAYKALIESYSSFDYDEDFDE